MKLGSCTIIIEKDVFSVNLIKKKSRMNISVHMLCFMWFLSFCKINLCMIRVIYSLFNGLFSMFSGKRFFCIMSFYDALNVLIRFAFFMCSTWEHSLCEGRHLQVYTYVITYLSKEKKIKKKINKLIVEAVAISTYTYSIHWRNYVYRICQNEMCKRLAFLVSPSFFLGRFIVIFFICSSFFIR